jgi:N utilization substance protein A
MSRTSEKFLEKLFEQEIPKCSMVWLWLKRGKIPGEKSKSSCRFYDDVWSVGACVGMKGSRIHGIVRELGNEILLILQVIFSCLLQEH